MGYKMLNKYSINVDEKTTIEVYAECVSMEESKIIFIREHHSIAEFAVWRYWKLEEEEVQ